MNRALGLLIARGWMNLCAIASFLIVGRFLSPAEFGIYALASSAILLPMALIGAGFADHVISRDPARKDEAAAFYMTAASGLAMAALAALTALLLTHGLGLPTMGRILLYLSPLPALWGVSVILEAMLVRDDRAGVMAAVTVSAETLGLIALIVAVLGGAGVLALVVSRLINNLVMLLGYWALVRPPSWARIERSGAAPMARFSLGVIGSRVLNWADAYGIEFLLGALLPAATVGFYRMAGRLNAAIGSVLVFAPWQAQLVYVGERFRAAPHRGGVAILRALQLHVSLIAPLFAGLAFTSRDLIHLLLGPAWYPTAEVLPIMALGSITHVIWGLLTAALIASGRSRRMFFFQGGLVAATSTALVIGANWGMTGAVLAKFTIAAACYVAGLFLIVELRRKDLLRIVLFLLRIAFACTLLGVAMSVTAHLLPSGDAVWQVLTRIVLSAFAGLAAYLLALCALAPDAVRLVMFVARKRWRRIGPATSVAQVSAPL